MKKVLIAILVLFIFVGCALKPVNNIEVPELENAKYAQFEVDALVEEYASFIREVEQMENDVAFLIGETWIYFQEGRMLSKESSQYVDQYQSLFYDYPIGRLTQLPEYQGMTVRSPAFLIIFSELLRSD